MDKLRVCRKCEDVAYTHKDLERFKTNKRSKHGYDSLCKKCHSDHNNKYNKKHIKYKGEWYRNKRNRNRDKLEKYIGGWVCNHCNFTHTTLTPFDFHHITPEEKEKEVSYLLTGRWENLKREVDKCILLCSNCHRIEHERLRKEITNDSYIRH